MNLPFIIWCSVHGFRNRFSQIIYHVVQPRFNIHGGEKLKNGFLGAEVSCRSLRRLGFGCNASRSVAGGNPSLLTSGLSIFCQKHQALSSWICQVDVDQGGRQETPTIGTLLALVGLWGIKLRVGLITYLLWEEIESIEFVHSCCRLGDKNRRSNLKGISHRTYSVALAPWMISKRSRR